MVKISLITSLVLVSHIAAASEYQISGNEAYKERAESDQAQREVVDITDDEISRLLIGTWSVPPYDDDYGEQGALTTYFEDNTLEYTQFASHDCQEVEKIIRGKWRVEDGRFIIYEMEKEDGSAYIEGLIIVDDVLAITEREGVFRSHTDGEKFIRIKSETCL